MMSTKSNTVAKTWKKYFLGVLAAVIFLAVVSFFRGDYSIITYVRLKHDIRQAETHTQELKDQKVILEAERERLKHDDEYIEKLAREKYKMTEKGEKLTRIIRSPERDNTASKK